MPFKVLNETCGDHFDGCRIILKKLKERGLVNFPGMVPGFSAVIKVTTPDEREAVLREIRQSTDNRPAQLGGPTDEQQQILDVLEENGGEMSYRALNEIISERFEGLRLMLKKLKTMDYVEFDGMIPGFSATIKLLKK